jgi:ribosomal protein S11
MTRCEPTPFAAAVLAAWLAAVLLRPGIRHMHVGVRCHSVLHAAPHAALAAVRA